MNEANGTVPHFEALTGFPPYPWQVRLFDRLMRGSTPTELTLPTGTGKTSFVLLYLIALARGATLPRRLAYVVDRRAIVDQTAQQLLRWIEAFATIDVLAEPLGRMAAFDRRDAPVVELGILRGGMVDSGQWRLDPAKPAVVVGTVDIIGSRLLFSGYGDGRSRRSLHAGLLGVDTTVVLDESHLSPAFAVTLREIERIHQSASGGGFRAVTMSATPREVVAAALEDSDESHPVLGGRIRAPKRPTFHSVDSPGARRQKIVDLALSFDSGAVLVYVRSAQEAQRIQRALVSAIGKTQEERVGLLTGTIRGAEREALAQTELWRRFEGPDLDRQKETVFLVATAAGEVGIDLDADHVVMDLAPLDSVIQRLGRVNRTGRGTDSTVHIVHADKDVEHDPAKADWRHRYAAACERTLLALQDMSSLSPIDLLGLPVDTVLAASTPAAEPAPPDADRVSMLSATSARLDLPAVEVHLRGISDEPGYAETQILWRWDVDLLLSRGASAARDAFTMHPPRPREVLKAPASIAATELARLAAASAQSSCFRIAPDGEVSVFELHDDARGLRRDLAYATLVLPTRIGGLSSAGFLDGSRTGTFVEDLADDDAAVRFIEEAGKQSDEAPDWIDRALVWRFPLSADSENEEEATCWLTYARHRAGELSLDADSDLSRLARRQQPLDDHNERVGSAARRIASALGLDEQTAAALEQAGRRHDEGKARSVWQRAAGNWAGGEPIAKSRRGRFRPELLGGYRHEFGSLAKADRELSVTDENPAQRELVLHLIAAHHGHARPGFPNARQWDPELPEEQCRQLALEAERRFAHLQETFGPWGLAWLEALVKCADAWVSSGHDAEEHP